MKSGLTNEALDLVAARFRILGEPMRLKLLRELQRGEKNVSELAKASKASQANVSRHLAVLLQSGILYRRRAGVSIYYGIQDESVFRLCSLVCTGLEKQIRSQAKAIRA